MRIIYVIAVPMETAYAPGIPWESLHPDTQVECVWTRNSFEMSHPAAGRSSYEAKILEMYVIEAALGAEEDGFDAVVVDSVSDSGVDVLRSRLSIPVVGPGETALKLASQLGRSFSVLIYNELQRHVIETVLDRHRLWDCCASIRPVDVTPYFVNPTEAASAAELGSFVAAGRRAIDEDGADVLVLGSTTMHSSAPRIAAKLDVPIISPPSVAVKQAEFLVQLGLSHSKRTYPPPAVLQDDKFHSLSGRADRE